MAIEAFRILIRRIAGQAPQETVISHAVRLSDAVKSVLKPLRLGRRLRLDHAPDDQTPPFEWLVVSIEPSGQQDLFQEYLAEFERDLEAEREADAALILAREAINLLRRLSEIARLTPTQFFEVVRDMGAQFPPVVGLAVGPHAPDQVVMRDPAGHDVVAQAVVLPQRVTLPERFEIEFQVASVGLYSAFIHLRMGNGKPYRRHDILFWGKSVDYRRFSDFFHLALRRRESLMCTVSETVNAKGKVARYEWISSGD